MKIPWIGYEEELFQRSSARIKVRWRTKTLGRNFDIRTCGGCNTEFKPCNASQKACSGCAPARRALKRLQTKTSWGRQHPQQYLLGNAKYRARKKNVPFEITADDIVIPSKCPALGTLFDYSRGKRYSPSLDRIRPELGYVPGNIQVISMQANVMKNNASPEELKMFAQWIFESAINA
jgi:hypothetical protein